MSNERTLYLSGPMTGLPDYNRQAFLDAEQALAKDWPKIINPVKVCADVLPPKSTFNLPLNKLLERDHWRICMRLNITALATCTHIALLEGWPASRGACLELLIAMDLGLEAYSYVNGSLHALTSMPETAQALSIVRLIQQGKHAIDQHRHCHEEFKSGWRTACDTLESMIRG